MVKSLVLTLGCLIAVSGSAFAYDCGFESSEGYTLGNVEGQGSPGWGKLFSGYESSGGNVVDTTSSQGSRSLYLSYYKSATIQLASVSHAKWYQFSIKSDWGSVYDPNECIQMVTTRGNLYDTFGINLYLERKTGKLEFKTSTGWINLADWTDKTWTNIAFCHEVTTEGIYNGNVTAYINGVSAGSYTVNSGTAYSGLGTIAFTTADWSHGGHCYIDDVHIGDTYVSSAVPEPGSILALGAGLLSLIGFRRRVK